MNIEAVLLTGGAGRRMGSDKAAIEVDGVPIGSRMVTLLQEQGMAVTVLGRKPILGAAFLPDSELFSGPLVALSRFCATCEFVLVVSCDLPLFDERVIGVLAQAIGQQDAAIPKIEGMLQPLCALYRARALDHIKDVLHGGGKSIMSWADRLNAIEVCDDNFLAQNIDPAAVEGVNTPEELAAALHKRQSRR